jgi:hypothetical protein
MLGQMKGKDNDVAVSMQDAISPYKKAVWMALTPRERLRRSWKMRAQLKDLQAVHDRKLFPKP